MGVHDDEIFQKKFVSKRNEALVELLEGNTNRIRSGRLQDEKIKSNKSLAVWITNQFQQWTVLLSFNECYNNMPLPKDVSHDKKNWILLKVDDEGDFLNQTKGSTKSPGCVYDSSQLQLSGDFQKQSLMLKSSKSLAELAMIDCKPAKSILKSSSSKGNLVSCLNLLFFSIEL